MFYHTDIDESYVLSVTSYDPDKLNYFNDLKKNNFLTVGHFREFINLTYQRFR